MQLSRGQLAPSFVANDIWGTTVDLSLITNKKILLSFFRYAECAVCQLRMVEIMREKERFNQQDIAVIAIFQSPAESLKKNLTEKINFSFTIIADPERILYDLYSVKPSWLKTFRTISYKGIQRIRESLREGFKPGGKVEGLFHQIPADFVIDQQRKILAVKYGKDVIDHTPLADILNQY